MERHVVVGTAGHIDHGKTALVRALTGVDTDRLAEEKRRGITIELGFAPLPLGDIAASVVDVPGHEGFVRTMVAGATGVDVALLVVAADEGVMPQTAEHLTILDVLGVTSGVVALTKCDLAPDPDWRGLVAEDVGALCERVLGRRWPVVEVSAETGAGLDALRAALAEAARGASPREAADRFRMPVDRTFALAGAGSIVTGTVWSGSAGEGDRVLVLPSGAEARVRSVEVHGTRATRAEPGRRAALALVGLERERAERGSVIVAGEGWELARVLDVEVRLGPGVPPLRPRQRVRVHHGTAEVMARVVPASGPASGSSFPARLHLEGVLVARTGDRFVLRSYSPVSTIGGGRVVDPLAGRVRRARARREGPPGVLPADDLGRVVLLVERRGPDGLDLPVLETASGLPAPRLQAALESALASRLADGGGWVVAREHVEATAAALVDALRRHHRAQPLEAGMSVQAWRSSCARARRELVALAEARLERDGSIVREGASVWLKGWSAGVGEAAARARGSVLGALESAGAEPPGLDELAARLPGVDVPGTLRLLEREGLVVAVTRERYYSRAAWEAERDQVVAILRELGEATPATIRERIGRTRKWLIPFLEHLDRVGVTTRRGDARSLGGDG